MRTAVVYFSRKGYTRHVADEIATRCEAEIFEITTPERTKGVLGFLWCGRFGMHRWGMPINMPDVDFSIYDKVVICSPVWVFSVSAPIREFIKRAAGSIKAADYVLLHFSFPHGYGKTLAAMDSILGIRHQQFTSVACQWGRFYKSRSLN